MQCWLEDLVVEQAKVTTVAALTSFGFQASTIYQGRNYSVNKVVLHKKNLIFCKFQKVASIVL